MLWNSLVALALGAAGTNAASTLRFSCSQLVVDRLDPLVNPGEMTSQHIHQVVGGNAFNASMEAGKMDVPNTATCTTCTFSEDFSNYWTAVLYFRAKNGTFRRVPQMGNVGFESANGGGMTIYYLTSGSAKVTAFKPGFRMLVGSAMNRDKAEAQKFRQLTYTCLQTAMTRSGETKDFPKAPCPAGIMANIRFPTCWDGKNLDSPDHSSHVSYPASGTFESNGPCPDTHPVKIPQLFFETVWDTRPFNNKADWPADGSQPFVWSNGDAQGYGTHGDYMFGWKNDALQKAMDGNCNVNCNALKTQAITAGNKCTIKPKNNDDITGWVTALPGQNPIS